jgi:hypothetical protein
MARTTRGTAMVDDLGASEQARHRLKAIVETMSGTKSIPEVCTELGISEAMFHKLRSRFLEDAVLLLEPRVPGPKRQEATPEERRIEDLEAEVQRTKMELEAARIRTEIALVMPHVLTRGAKKTADDGEKPMTRKERRRQERREEKMKRRQQP